MPCLLAQHVSVKAENKVPHQQVAQMIVMSVAIMGIFISSDTALQSNVCLWGGCIQGVLDHPIGFESTLITTCLAIVTLVNIFVLILYDPEALCKHLLFRFVVSEG